MVLTASISDASFNHLGSTATEGFLDSRDDIRAQFLGYCIKGKLVLEYSGKMRVQGVFQKCEGKSQKSFATAAR